MTFSPQLFSRLFLLAKATCHNFLCAEVSHLLWPRVTDPGRQNIPILPCLLVLGGYLASSPVATPCPTSPVCSQSRLCICCASGSYGMVEKSPRVGVGKAALAPVLDISPVVRRFKYVLYPLSLFAAHLPGDRKRTPGAGASKTRPPSKGPWPTIATY